MTERIHKSVRSAFRDEMAHHLTLAKIHSLFEDHEFQRNTHHRYIPPVQISRNRLRLVECVEQYYNTIDFTSLSLNEANRLLSVYSDVLRIVPSSATSRLIDVLSQYNHKMENYGKQSRFRIIPIRSLSPFSPLPSSNLLNDKTLSQGIADMRSMLENEQVWASVAQAKELVECLLGALADDMDIPGYETLRKYKQKYSAVANKLEILPNSNDDLNNESKRVRNAINTLLNGLLNIATGINDVRNADASHGNLGRYIRIQHARLVVGSTEQLISFLLETHDHMISVPPRAPALAEPYDETTLPDPSKRANDA